MDSVITAFATLSESPYVTDMLTKGLLILVAAVVIALTLVSIKIILFIISLFKKNISLTDLFSSSINYFTKQYPSMVRYMIPVVILWLISIILNVYTIFFDSKAATLFAFMIFLIMISYYFVLDASIVKTRYHGKGFQFITIPQVARLLMILIMYLILSVLSLALLGFPWILLSYIIYVIRLPIICNNMRTFEAIKFAIKTMKKNSWNVIALTTAYVLVTSILTYSFGWIPMINQFIYLLTLIIIRPFASILLTEGYIAIEKTN